MGVLVAVGLECGTGLESAGGRSVVQGGEGHMGDEVSKAKGDSEFVGEDAECWCCWCWHRCRICYWTGSQAEVWCARV